MIQALIQVPPWPHGVPFFPALAIWGDLPTTALEACRRLETFALQLSPWEAAVVGSYLVVMAALSAFGLHRSWLTAVYFQRRARAGVEVPAGALSRDELPRVTVQLPLYNERFVVEELIETVSRLDYPRAKLEIQVLDDSTDETTELARTAVARMAAGGVPIELLHRDDRTGFKAGALQAGLECAHGELVAVFDADFRPQRDFLLRTVGSFRDPRVGMVQARWTYENREESTLTRLQAIMLDGHFIFEQGGRSRSGRYFNFNGTAGLLRRTMIEDAGGWQHDTLTEDTDLSYRAQLRGWKFIYLQDLAAPSALPADMASFQVQQARWAKGLVQTGVKLLPRIFRAPIPAGLKAEACFHLTANLSYPLMLLLALLIVPSTFIRFHSQEPWLLLFDAPIFLATFGSLAGFYLLSQREVHGRIRWSDVALFPLVLATGIGMTFSNTQAVLEALLGVRTPFRRTAKVSPGSAASSRSMGSAYSDRHVQLVRSGYRPQGGWLPWANLAAAAYFLAGLLYSIHIGNWAMTPFLTLFLVGFGYSGGLTLYQSQERRLVAETRTPLSAGLRG